jgi:hypothetical protein
MKANWLSGRRGGSLEKRERRRPVGDTVEKVADFLAALALPAFVLVVVVNRLALGVSGRRARDKRHGSGRKPR